jgi:phospholipid/cholesterol/gamma-HCH transport system ATP-binding protein
MIRTENIHKKFGDHHVLKGITTEFFKGKTNLIIGRSGAGKTVLLKLLVGLLEPTEGSIFYDDVNFSKLGKKMYAPCVWMWACCSRLPPFLIL